VILVELTVLLADTGGTEVVLLADIGGTDCVVS
jgi:hypothetical protein